MLRIRELAELAQRLSVDEFARQMGPFALVQRPRPESRVEQARTGPGETHLTDLQPALRIRGRPLNVDFGDLLVALLPPMQSGALELVLGRAPDCDVIIDDDKVSRRHAVIHWKDEQGVVSELGSANGTFINGHRMKDRWTLRPGDEVMVGDSTFTFMLAEPLHQRLRRLVQVR